MMQYVQQQAAWNMDLKSVVNNTASDWVFEII